MTVQGGGGTKRGSGAFVWTKRGREVQWSKTKKGFREGTGQEKETRFGRGGVGEIWGWAGEGLRGVRLIEEMGFDRGELGKGWAGPG